jgi:hypothetical protein
MRIRLWPYIVLSVILLAAPHWAQESPKLSVRSLMTESEFRMTGLKKLTPEELAQLNDWLARFATAVVDASKQTKSRRPTTPPVVTLLSLADLEGAIIVANDGHPLAVITSNCFNSDALCNEFGKYGNEFNSDSILNEFGTYGNEFSSKSPFNEFTTRHRRFSRTDEP